MRKQKLGISGLEVPIVCLGTMTWGEQVRVMGALIAEGKIRHWGLSNETSYGVSQMCEAAKRLGVPPPVSIQNDFAPVFRHFEEELAETCAPSAYNVGLRQGAPPELRHNPPFQPRYFNPRTLAAAGEYGALAKRCGLSPTTLALAWCASRWYMSSVIIGATSQEQLKEDIEACQVVLDASTLEEMDAIHLRHRNPNDLD
ncbi:Protein tas [Tetrabaena socialis]|uniref:Protein tas n=1 Tax=Tetrabaena socialis TaxID=47790 RepID=A0A2J7ZWK3_9CHLO|nr:Protein tas [Tetrabaena socialis]|eukprot:PNH04650.1 Protein tas [Tetrabaena socialis]